MAIEAAPLLVTLIALLPVFLLCCCCYFCCKGMFGGNRTVIMSTPASAPAVQVATINVPSFATAPAYQPLQEAHPQQPPPYKA